MEVDKSQETIETSTVFTHAGVMSELNIVDLVNLINWYFGKQWRLRWNAANCSIASGSALFVKTKTTLRGWHIEYM